jgi:hypothetical protein
MGEVRKVLTAKDPNSRSQQWVEYTVDVEHRTGNGITVTTTYNNVVSINAFGGTADYMRATYRAGEFVAGEMGVGSKVLVMCISGDQQKAIIVGGIPDDKYKFKDPNDGHSLHFEFNGIQAQINKDGELKVQFRGATDANGKLNKNANSKAEGTSLTIDKEGVLTLATPENAQFIKLDHKNQKLDLLVDKEWTATVNGKTQFDIQNDLILNCSDGGCSIGVSNNVTIKSQGVLVGGAKEAWVLGTTYRAKESALNSSLSSSFTTASTQAGIIAGALTSASPFLAIPFVGGALASPFIAMAATTATSLASTFGMMSASLSQFEGGASTYISTRNFGD